MTRAPEAAPALVPAAPFTTLPVSALLKGSRRLDAESYLSGGHQLRQRIGSLPVVARLDTFADVWHPARLKGIQVRKRDGLPFLAATQVFDIVPTCRKWLSASHTPALLTRYVEPGWILVTCSGSVGDAIVAYKPHAGVVVSHDLLRMLPKEAATANYFYAFLRTKYARTMMRSTQAGSAIKHLEPEHVVDIPVATVGGEEARACVALLIQRAFALRDEAHDLTISAHKAFGEAIGGLSTEPDPEVGFSVSASTFFGGARRLDAFSYNPGASAALEAIKRSGHPTDDLRALARIFGVPRFKHVYTSAGTAYLDSEDLFKVNPESTKFIPAGHKRDAAEYMVSRGWLLMACSGQTYGVNGSVVLATRWHEKKIVSNHVLRIVPVDTIRAGYLATALSHAALGRPLVLRAVHGTSVPEIDPRVLGSMPIVRLADTIEGDIADMAEQASTRRLEADDAENAAVAFVEAAVGRALGEVDDDAYDAALADLRIVELAVDPSKVVSGAALRRRLAELG